MLLQLSTWIEIEDYLSRSKTVLVPIGSIEQHGPNGLLGTDALCPEIIAQRAAEQTEILIAPTFNVGSAQHHLAFPGTISLRPSTMTAAICDWTASLLRHGFERIYWFNGHGGNIAPIQAAFAEIYAERSFLNKKDDMPALKLKLQSWWLFPEVAELCNQLYPEGNGQHATASEIAVTQFGYPDFIKSERMSPAIAPAFSGIADAEDFRNRYPDGRIGSNPLQANKKDGALIVETAAKMLVQDFRAFSTEN